MAAYTFSNTATGAVRILKDGIAIKQRPKNSQQIEPNAAKDGIEIREIGDASAPEIRILLSELPGNPATVALAMDYLDSFFFLTNVSAADFDALEDRVDDLENPIPAYTNSVTNESFIGPGFPLGRNIIALGPGTDWYNDGVGATNDGVAFNSNQIFLILGPDSGEQFRGLYTTPAPSSTMTRLAGYTSIAGPGDLKNLLVTVTLGTVYAGTKWFQYMQSGVIDTDPVRFTSLVLDSTNIGTNGTGMVELMGDGTTVDFYVGHPFNVQYALTNIIQNFGEHDASINGPLFPYPYVMLVHFDIAPLLNENRFLVVNFKL